jgi:DNA polymerase alpha subunit B
VEVDLTHLKAQTELSYSLFPGQIVAVEGINTNGRKLVAHRICEGAAPEAPTSTVKELMAYHHDETCQGGKPVSIMAVAGPFTTSDNLNYEPLLDLMETVRLQNPSVVILMGPFVDVRHKAVQSGQATLCDENGDEILVPYETFFANKVAALLEELFQEGNATTQFVLVPSLDDATAEWV